MKVLLTGGTGFIGRAIFERMIRQESVHVVIATRLRSTQIGAPTHIINDLSGDTDWRAAVDGCDVVIHAAARAHVTSNGGDEQLSSYKRVNVDGALNLARQAAAAGVKRFVFISSIGVNGNANVRPYTAQDPAQPVEPYAQSKWEAEQGLWRVQQETGMEVVVIRPPLVYGPNAPGNFGSLVRWIGQGIPLPLGAVHNRRSLVGIDNLVDLIVRCVDHPSAANNVFLAGDGRALSTSELLRLVGEAMEKPARLIPVPAAALQLGATLLGRKAMAQRLLGSLQVDISHTCETLDWQPPFTVEEGLRRCFSPLG